jgi:hypothetical protein
MLNNGNAHGSFLSFHSLGELKVAVRRTLFRLFAGAAALREFRQVSANSTILAISRACGLGSVIFTDIFAEDIPSEVLECFVLYRFWPDAE